MGLQGQVLNFVVSADAEIYGDAGDGEPGQPSEIKYE